MQVPFLGGVRALVPVRWSVLLRLKRLLERGLVGAKTRVVQRLGRCRQEVQALAHLMLL